MTYQTLENGQQENKGFPPPPSPTTSTQHHDRFKLRGVVVESLFGILGMKTRGEGKKRMEVFRVFG